MRSMQAVENDHPDTHAIKTGTHHVQILPCYVPPVFDVVDSRWAALVHQYCGGFLKRHANPVCLTRFQQ